MKTRFLITALIALVVPIHAAVYQPGGGGTGAGGAITGAYAFSAGFNVTQATNVALNPVLSNQVVTGISQGATNAGFYVGSSSGKGTNTQIFVSATVSGRFETTNGIVVFGDINNPNVMTNYNQFWMRAQLVLNDSGNSILIRDGAFLDLKSGGAIVMGSDSTTNRIQVGPNSYVTSPVGGSDNNEIYRYRFWADGGISALASNRVMRFWELSNYVSTVSGVGVTAGTNVIIRGTSLSVTGVVTTINALDYGLQLAVGGQQTAIQAAVDAAAPLGQAVQLPAGPIYVSGTINVPARVRIQGSSSQYGSGKGTFIYPGSMNGPVFLIVGEGVAINDLSIFGDAPNTGTIGIKTHGTNSAPYLSFRNIHTSFVSEGIVLTNSWNVDLLGYYATTVSNGLSLLGDCNAVHILGGEINAATNGIYLSSQQSGVNGIQISTTIEGCYRGIHATNAVNNNFRNLIIRDCYFENNTYSVWLDGGANVIQKPVISGNMFGANSSGVGTNIWMKNVQSPTISDNDFASTQPAMVIDAGTFNMLISGNMHQSFSTSFVSSTSYIDLGRTNISVVGGSIQASNFVLRTSQGTNSLVNFLNSSENTHLFRPMQQRILTTNNALATPRILFAGDSLTGISDATFQNSPGGELVKQMNQIYNNGDWNPFGRLWVSFSGGANPAWIGTNWFGHNTWSLPTGTAVQFISYTNINLIQAAWIRQVAGNANLAIWTNNGAGGADALCATLEGFNATPQGAFTNIPVALGNYSVRFEQTGAALKTNVTIFISGQKTNSGGFASYFFATGGSTMTNFIAVPAAVKNPILSAIAPDVIIWEALDFTEVGGDQGYTNALNALYASLTNACGTSLVFGLVGVPNGQVNSGAYDQQNATARRMCQNQGWIYLDGTIPRSIYTNGLSDDTVHYNTNSAPIAGAAMGVQLGLLPPMAPLGAIWANLQAKIAGNVGGGGGTPAGNSGAVQFNEGGAFAGTNSFIADRTNNVFRVSAPSGMPGISIELPGVGSNTFGFRQLTYNPGTGNTYDFLPSVNANGGFGLTSLGSIQPVTSNFMSAGTFLRPFSTNYANDYVAFETISTPLLSLTGNTNGSASFYDSAGTEYAQLVAINNIQTNNVHILWTNATSGVVVAQPNGTGTNQLQNIALTAGQSVTLIGTTYSANTITATTVSGAGSGNTNYTINVVPGNINDFYLGSSNVAITAIMGTVLGTPIYWNAYVTNLSAGTWGIGFSAVTNRIRFSGIYGTNAPTVLTNNTCLALSGRSDGTNTLIGYTYYAPGL